MASERGISSQLHFLPETDDILSYYRATDAVVIASESEGFSLYVSKPWLAAFSQ